MVEIEAGIIKLGRISPGRRHVQLKQWFAVLLEQMAERILPMDLDVARIAAAITDRNAARGLNPGFADIAIAATAIAYDLTLLSRNLSHFAASGAAVMDPFARLPL